MEGCHATSERSSSGPGPGHHTEWMRGLWPARPLSLLASLLSLLLAKTAPFARPRVAAFRSGGGDGGVRSGGPEGCCAQGHGRFQLLVECSAGSVGAALMTDAGDIFTGICIDARSSLGFCAEHAAVAEMLKHRQTRIRAIVAVDQRGQVLPPCGRCRELLRQTDPANSSTQVILPGETIKPLSALLPFSHASQRTEAGGQS